MLCAGASMGDEERRSAKGDDVRIGIGLRRAAIQLFFVVIAAILLLVAIRFIIL